MEFQIYGRELGVPEMIYFGEDKIQYICPLKFFKDNWLLKCKYNIIVTFIRYVDVKHDNSSKDRIW